jgi:predicted RNA methylase
MSNYADLADYRWLVGPEADAVLDDLSGRGAVAGAEPIHAAASRLRRQFSAARVHLLLDQVELRRRGVAKFSRPERMFFTRLLLQQATDEWVARYKVARFADRDSVADLCCGIGGDLLALAEHGSTVGVDRDPIANCLATANAQAILPPDVAGSVSLQTREIERFDAGAFAAWHIDPDRRPAGNRTTSIEWSSPDREVIERLLAITPNAAIKLAPAADVPEKWAEQCELEWISRDRECRQQVAWHGELANNAAGQRRATALASDGRVLRTISGHPESVTMYADQLEGFLFEPDAAVLAADLAGELAAEHELSAVSPEVAYFTGPQPISDPAVACFAVDEVLPLNLRRVAQHLRARGIGRLEIKKRGVEHDPQQVRRALKLWGDDSATLILTKVNCKRTAIVARRVIFDQSSVSPIPDPRPLAPSAPDAACL